MNASEQKMNFPEIEAIARQFARPLAEVAAIYAHVHDDLKARALVRDYLPVLVARKVRASYHLRPAEG
jgi:hypothetical protein